MVSQMADDIFAIFNNVPHICIYNMFSSAAFGCSNPRVPDGAFVDRQGDRIVIACTSNDGKWEVICRDGQWHGDFGECPERKHTAYVCNACVNCMYTTSTIFQMALRSTDCNIFCTLVLYTVLRFVKDT